MFMATRCLNKNITTNAGGDVNISIEPRIYMKIYKMTEPASHVKEEDDIFEDTSLPSAKVPIYDVTRGLREVAELQLREDSAVHTLVYVLKQCVVLGDDAGYIDAREKLEKQSAEIPDINASFALAGQYIKEGKEFEMMLMCKAVVTWYKYHALDGADGKECMTKIVEECIFQAKNAAIKILSEGAPEKQIYHPRLMTLLYEMLSDLKVIQITDEEFKVDMETLASYYIACVHYYLHEWRQMYDISYMAATEMHRMCGTDAKTYLSYGNALFMAGMAKYYLHDFAKAKNLWMQAKEVFTAIGSIRDLGFTDDWITIVQRNLDYDLAK